MKLRLLRRPCGMASKGTGFTCFLLSKAEESYAVWQPQKVLLVSHRHPIVTILWHQQHR